MSGRVVCVGHVMVDVIATLAAPLAPGSDTPAPIELRPGGSAANTAAWAARAGATAIFVGRVGDDEFGRRAVSTLQKAGVALYVTADPHRPTGMCLVLVGPDGERTMVPSAGANSNLQATDLPDVAAGDLWHLSGYVLFDPASRAAGLAALDRARAGAARLSVDAASSAPLAALGAGRFLDIVAGTDLLLANRDEAAVLTYGLEPEPAAARLHESVPLVVVKDGAGGVVVAADRTVRRFAGLPSTARDSTGAGDAFAGTLLARVAAGAQLTDAVAAAGTAAAEAIRHLGARPDGAR
jgi:sugar/nucleoside kinase (ribokinase family)